MPSDISGSSSRLAAVWFVDLVGYSRMASRDEATAITLVDSLRSAVAEVLEEHRGRLVKSTGDGALAEFASARDAVRSALALQRRFAERAGGIAPNARLRVGVHVGEVVPDADGDIFGDGVNTAARLQQSAEPGEIVVSEDVWRSLRQRMEFRFAPIGERRLKGLATPIRAFRVEASRGGGVVAPAIGWTRSFHRYRLLYAVTAAVVIAGFGILAWEIGRGEEGTAPVADGASLLGASGTSLAILPFESLDPDPDSEYFADGMTEELIGALGRLRGLDVVGRTSSWALEDAELDIREIAERLDAAVVLTGSVRKSESRLRVHAQLVDARSGYQLWSETYDREPDDVLDVQENIARSVVTALDLRLPRGLDVFRVRDRVPDPLAYDLYLRGRYAWRRRTQEGLDLAVDLFRRAIERDPDFAAAHVGLADAYINLSGYGYRSADEVERRALEAVESALELDPELAEAYASRANLRARTDHEMDLAIADLRRAIELNPSYPGGYHWLGLILTSLGRVDEALRMFERGIELDPLAPALHAAYSRTLWVGNHLERAEAMARKANELSPEMFGPLTVLGRIYSAEGRGPEAIRVTEEAVALDPGNPMALAHLARVHARHGDREKALEIVSRLEAFPDPCVACVAEVYVALGDEANALRWLDAGTWQNLGGFFLPKVDPLYDPLREDPRFRRFLREVGLE